MLNERKGGRLRRSPARGTASLMTLVVLVVWSTPVRSQASCYDDGTPARMQMLLEKTIFQVDVLELSVRIGGQSGRRLRSLAQEGERTSHRADSVARIAAGATCANARLDFVRDVSLEQLLDAIRGSSAAAREAGLIESETYALIDGSLSEWYAFLEGRGVRDGDRMSYRIRGDTLGIRYRSAGGELLLDRTDVGAGRRRSVLAGYFAPGSDFREGLVDALFRESARQGGG